MAQNDFGTFERISLELSRAITPLIDRLQPQRVLDIFAEFGLVIPHGLMSSGLKTTIQQTALSVEVLKSLTEELLSAISEENIGAIIGKGLEISQQIKRLLESINSISTEINSINFQGGLTQIEFDDFLQKLPGRLTETLLIEHLEGFYSTTFRIFEIFGIITLEKKNAEATNEMLPAYVEKKLNLGLLSDFLDNPQSLAENIYDWGSDDFNSDLLIKRLYQLFLDFGIPVAVRTLDDADSQLALEWMLFSLAPTSGVSPKGLDTTIMVDLSENFALSIPITEKWAIDISIEIPAQATAGIRFQPPADLSLIPISGNPQGKASFQLVNTAPAEERISILTISGGSGISAQSIGAGIDTTLIWDSDKGEAKGEFGISGKIIGGKVIISSEGSDGFLASLLSNVNINADFDLGLGWSTGSGFYISGSGSLNIQLPLHINLGPIDLEAIILSIGFSDGSFPLEFSTNIKAALGPLQLSIERIGVSAKITPANEFQGNLGPLDVGFGFKPPNGVGLSIDAGAVKGGGYLFFDFDREEYAGALELVFSEWIALKAIGLITTRMPDGSKGFSLLIIITVEFGSGIQLGFGFTLLGVGGILGLNRTVNIQPLAEGVRTGAIESVMFPQNVIENAPRIISDLRQFFPPAEGIFLVGPMAKIGYGTPTLISLSLGVILEFPDVTITILGVLKVVLPTEEADILRLQVNFIGRIEPSNKLLWFYAELFDSRVLFMTLEGGMGLLVNWGEQANFVVSIGGFHPRFTPPPLPFPSPPRLAISILNTSIARIRVEAYFAVTSNTVQFGARAEMYFGFSAISVEGHLGFDALFQFDPFYFILEISAKLSVKVFGFGVWGISLSASLEGPTPWKIKGKASFKVTWLGPRIRVNISKTWGENKATELPPIEILPLLTKELNALTNWEAVIPANSQILVSLRKLGETDTEQLILHPVGKLRIRQRKMPLNLQMDKFGTQRPSDYNQFTVSATISGLSSTPTDVQDKFASAEFLDLDNTQKLSARGFEPQDSGIEIAVEGEQLRTSMAVKRENRYETIIIDNNFKRFKRNVYQFVLTAFIQLGGLFSHFLKGSAVSKSVLSQAYQKKIQPFAEVIQVQPNMYTVATNSNNQAVNANAMNFSSQAKANQFMQAELQRDPSLAGNLHVIPNTELNLAA